MNAKKRIAAGITGTAIILGGNHILGSESAAGQGEAQVTCEIPVSADRNSPTNTVSGLADTFGVGQSEVKVYHPGSATPEKRPIYEMQPGDIAAAQIGAVACREIGGNIGDPTHPNVITE